MSIEPYKVDDIDEDVIESQHPRPDKVIGKKAKPPDPSTNPSSNQTESLSTQFPTQSASVNSNITTSTGTTSPDLEASSTAISVPSPSSDSKVSSDFKSAGTPKTLSPSSVVALVTEADPESPLPKEPAAKLPADHHLTTVHQLMRIQPGPLLPSAESRFRNHRTRDLVTPDDDSDTEVGFKNYNIYLNFDVK
jgi:hypothetical protein